MASKSKRARQAAVKAKTKSAWPVILWALVAAYVGYLHNKNGQYSDVLGFYGSRFLGGTNPWPFNWNVPFGYSSALHPIEYPVISGVIVWLLSFATPQSGDPTLNYFTLNVIINAVLFAITAYLVKKISNNTSALLYIFSPAVVLALNLNWDLWAVMPMLLAIKLYKDQKYELSAVFLALGIATKFFPVVLLIPIGINLIRSNKSKELYRYLGITFAIWLLVNLPVMLISFEGWKYFYVFSFNRKVGDGSIFSILYKLNPNTTVADQIYLFLNLIIFSLLIYILFKLKKNLELEQSAALAMFAFTLFGKQYSMQYVLWLAPVLVLAIASAEGKHQKRLQGLFAIWGISELLFRYTYFRNLLTNTYLAKDLEIRNSVSDQMYAYSAILRYVSIVVLVIYLIRAFAYERLPDRTP